MYSFCTTIICVQHCSQSHISLNSALPSASVVIISYLVFPVTFVRAYLTFPKAVVLILKHATSLRHSMLPGPALIQADLDYHMAGVDKKIQQHIVASQGHPVELDRAFIMAIEMVRLFCVCSSHMGFYFQLRSDKCVCIRGTGKCGA